MINNIRASWVKEINKLTQKTSVKEHKSKLLKLVNWFGEGFMYNLQL
jgi:hypothetical protein